MDAPRFDALTHTVSHLLSRRRLATAFGVVAFSAPRFARAKKKRKKLKRNIFGCVNVGGKCQGKSANCCSGICEGKKPKNGKKDKSRCVAHNELDCPAGANSCLQSIPCGTNGNGLCAQTTGQASFCGAGVAICSACTKDADCEALGFGQGAACAVCIGCTQTGNTLCMSAAV